MQFVSCYFSSLGGTQSRWHAGDGAPKLITCDTICRKGSARKLRNGLAINSGKESILDTARGIVS